ncbi:LysR family transcriptional regulator [Tateyamaria omphalii]|uniref:LysR family transcriptional regulator n=1 Tax=Tateyamaria omphalii TaxID=299262 RepID=A0A1P8MXC5_9RHOB|nr:LysR family transcriptional regulator [Tateyamaria omphalii]APX12569.1 LysR family transcriptional regulator [Tateyamaria omphalii]
MNLQTLRSFVEVHRRGSISDAARGLGLTQPAVSQHVAALEAQLGRPLFVRRARGMAPTPLADDLAQQIGDGLDRAEAALATLKARSTSLTGTVHIAGPAELMAEWMAQPLSALWQAGLQIRLQFGGRDALYDMLRGGRVDLACTASKPADPQLDAARIGSERLLLVAAPALAARLNDAADLQTALRQEGYVSYDSNLPLIRTWCAANGIDLGPVMPVVTAPDIRALRAYAEAGAGWSVIPDYLCVRALDERTLVEVAAPAETPEASFYLVWNKSALRHPRVAFARQTLLDAMQEG